MKITIVSGSHRNPSQSEKIARYIENVLQEKFSDADPFLYSLADNPLPLWEQSIWDGDETWVKRLAPVKEELVSSDAFVFVVPEWHGQVPAGVKNFFLMFNRYEVGHKPAFIVTVSNGTGGAYPVAELRMSSYKNNRICYIPEQLIVRDVEKVFNDNPDDNDQEADSYFKERLEWCLEILMGYGVALRGMRESTQIHHDKFANGM
jgi:NAD(P)H-dependent FMN reductase